MDINLCRYDLMKRCWHDNPERRPPFQGLVVLIDDMVKSGTFELEMNIYEETEFKDMHGITDEDEEKV